jgi:hypothetical protein
MKTLIALIALTLTALTGLPNDASAWYCRAYSTNGATGWGRASGLDSARVRALYECAIRTPRNHTCYVRFCN